MNKADTINPVDQATATAESGTATSVSPKGSNQPIAVILPAYRDVEMTKRCICTAMPGILAVANARLLLINDASPDAGMQTMLEDLASQWPDRCSVLKNDHNLGFVKTVNRGLAYFGRHDVVLLNSDVIVPKDWLGRLADEAYSKPNIATLTPLSNNATICSFPNFLQQNAQPFNLEVDAIDIVFRHTKLPCVEAPTGVGFCMYIRRSCLDQIGYLNEEKFGRGYGEENDLCQRALAAGWLNLISPNLYAFHEGNVSFSSDKQALVDRAMQVIDELHPNYHADVQRFIKADPLKTARVARYIQLLSATAIPKVLHVSHAIGGGVGQHVDELAQYFGQRAAHILLAPHGDNNRICISLGMDRHADKLVYDIPFEYDDLLELLKALGVSAVHFHHTIGLHSKMLDLPHDLGVAHLLTVHDFYWLSGNPTLTNENGQYPGFYSDKLHNPLYPSPEGLTPEDFRASLSKLFNNAASVIFPSTATKLIFTGVVPLKNSVVAPHPEIVRNVNRPPIGFTKKAGYTIGVLGALSLEKGADLLEELSLIARSRDLPFKFKLLGYAYRPLKTIETTGPYASNELSNLIKQHELDVIFFPAQWPETYSYTLSYALDSGLPIIAPNLGAFAERLSCRANTLLFNHLTSASELIEHFIAFIDELGADANISAPRFEEDESKHDYYDQAYLEIVKRDLIVSEPGNQTILSIPNAVLRNTQISVEIKHGWRETVLSILWHLYTRPSMRWMSRVIPYDILRSIKRLLSRRPIHDIIKSHARE